MAQPPRISSEDVVPPGPEREDADRLGPYGSWPYVDRRRGGDRRAQPTPFFSRFMIGGRRAVGRRRGERHNIYVDRYDRIDVILAVAVLVLNILDAFFTLLYVGHQGGEEANPVARFLMEADPEGHSWFLLSKCGVVLLCVLFLVMHKTFRFVRPALVFLLGFYTVLFAYHVYLQANAL